jgi:hypothetical protein
MRKALKDKVREFGYGLIPGSSFFQLKEMNRLERIRLKKQEGLIGTLNHPEITKERVENERATSKISSLLLLGSATFIEGIYSLGNILNSVHDFTNGYYGSGISKVACSIMAKEVINYMHRVGIKAINERIMELENPESSEEEYREQNRINC